MFNLSIEAFLLGISTGSYCFAQCGMVIIPYVFSEDKTEIRSNYPIILQFLMGRFLAYTIVGLLIGFLGQTMYNSSYSESSSSINIFIGISYIILSALLIINVFTYRLKNKSCKLTKFKEFSHYPVLLGIFTGINICPPFILAITKAFDTKSVLMGGVFFIMFFIATSIFILPLVFSGLLKRIEAIITIARITSVLAGAYLAIQGVMYIYFS